MTCVFGFYSLLHCFSAKVVRKFGMEDVERLLQRVGNVLTSHHRCSLGMGWDRSDECDKNGDDEQSSSNVGASVASELLAIVPPSTWNALLGWLWVPSVSETPRIVTTDAHRLFDLKRRICFLFTDIIAAALASGLDDVLVVVALTFAPWPTGTENPPWQRLLLAIHQGNLSAVPLFRSLCQVPAVLCRMLAANASVTFKQTACGFLLFSQADEEEREETSSAQLQQQQVSTAALIEVTTDAAVHTDLWVCLHSVLNANATVTVAYLKQYLVDFVLCAIRLLSGATHGEQHMEIATAVTPGSFCQIWQVLKMLACLMGEAKFGKARSALAESPALLVAILRHTNHPSFHVRYEVYHCLKIFVAKPNKPAPIRYVLWINRTSIARFVANHHDEVNQRLRGMDGGSSNAMEGDGGTQSFEEREAERSMLFEKLSFLEALSRDEMVLLSVDDR